MQRPTGSRRHGCVGFTLIELVISAAIIGILASVALPLTELTVRRAKEQDLRRALREVRTAIDAYKQAVDEGRISRVAGASGYPRSLDVLVQGVSDARSPSGAKIYFLRRMPRDPFSTDPALPAADTWGKRSYASPPEEPREGEDVFDIFTRAPGRGLNGIAYSEW